MTRVVCVAQGMAAGNNRSRPRTACPPACSTVTLRSPRGACHGGIRGARNATNGLIISAEDAGVESHRERHSSRWSLDVGRVVDARLRRPGLRARPKGRYLGWGRGGPGGASNCCAGSEAGHFRSRRPMAKAVPALARRLPAGLSSMELPRIRR